MSIRQLLLVSEDKALQHKLLRKPSWPLEAMASLREQMSFVGSPTGALGHVYDSKELNVSMAKKAMAPVVSVFIFMAVFFGVIFRTVLICEGDELLSAVLYMVAVIAPVLFLVS